MRIGAWSKLKWIVYFVSFITGIAMVTVSAQDAASGAVPRVTSDSASTLVPDSGGGDGCNPSRPNNYPTRYSAGADSNNVSSVPGGVYATISNYSPFVAGSNQGAPSSDNVSEWAMLDVQPASTDEYAQIGWMEFPGGVRHTFDEYSTGPNAYHDDYVAPFPINSKQTYGVLFSPHTEYGLTVTVNGKTYQSFYEEFWTPNDAQVFAETHTQASQIPGGTDDPAGQVAQVSNAHVWPTAGSGGWENFDGSTYTAGGSNIPGPSWIGIAPKNSSNANSWRTWDDACLY